LFKKSCDKVHACGHSCMGYRGEEKCLPCLNSECARKARIDALETGNKENVLLEGIDEDSFCTICWVSELSSEPCIKLDCGHVFHLNCIKSILEKKWTSFRVTFAFMDCPSCKQEMKLDNCEPLAKIFNEIKEIKEKI